MCYGSPFAAVCCAFAVTSGGLAILGDNDMQRADRCCSVLCLPCYDRRARHNDQPDTTGSGRDMARWTVKRLLGADCL